MGRLGSIRLKYLHAFRDHTGRARYYFRRHGIRTALPGIPGSTEFMDAYAAQLSNTPKAAEPRPAAIPGSFAALAIPILRVPSVSILVCNEPLQLSTCHR